MAYIDALTFMIAKNNMKLDMLFSLGLVTYGLSLKGSYHTLYAKSETPKVTMQEKRAVIKGYPLTKSHIRFPILAPRAPKGPNNSPEIKIIPTWGCSPSPKFKLNAE